MSTAPLVLTSENHTWCEHRRCQSLTANMIAPIVSKAAEHGSGVGESLTESRPFAINRTRPPWS